MQECPLCGSKAFFLRDPEDEYEMITFEIKPQGIVFSEERDPAAELSPGREVFCDRCSWHGNCAQLLPG